MKKIENLDIDVFAMNCALAQARRSFDQNEVPIGAVIVDKDGNIIARAYNQVEKKGTQLAHAELQVLAKTTKKMKRWRLNDLTMYVTLQPCAMCMSALVLSRIGRIVYAANSPLFGCKLDKLDWFGIYKDSLPIVDFQERVESINLLKKFFIKQRKIKNGS
ncbi:nucleoside deaminase [Candidatus Babeliales bacterium]|nr:nucleoside deaminase [Candidatus Babeliales bacterium]MBP9843752.1 nucleoside deaminase [Candidatus Babeliales bacterium]